MIRSQNGYSWGSEKIVVCAVTMLLLCATSVAHAQTDTTSLKDNDEAHLPPKVPRSNDPNAYRLFFAPTSETLSENHGTVQLAEFVVPNINYGVLDELIVRAGFTPFTISSHTLYYALGGLQVFDYDGFSGVGGLVLTNATGDDRGWEQSLYGFGVVGYTAQTYGIYGGFGGGYSASRESNTAVFMLGGEYSITAHNKLITENWYEGETGTALFAAGIRIYGAVLSCDFAIGALTEAHTFKVTTLVPWLSLSYHFDLSEDSTR